MCELNENFDWEQFLVPSEEGFYLFGGRYKFRDPDLGLEKLLYYASDEFERHQNILDQRNNLECDVNRLQALIDNYERQLQRIRDVLSL